MFDFLYGTDKSPKSILVAIKNPVIHIHRCEDFGDSADSGPSHMFSYKLQNPNLYWAKKKERKEMKCFALVDVKITYNL